MLSSERHLLPPWKSKSDLRASQSSVAYVSLRITLPVPDLSFQNFHKQTDELLIKPGARRPKLNSIRPELGNDKYEVQVYNYDNPNDSQYCSQNNSIVDNEPDQNSFQDDEGPPISQQMFMDEHLVNAPETVSATHIPYAMQAKKMDMKKLKNAVWKCVTMEEQEVYFQFVIISA
jgi:condensin complex subunit 2